MCAIPAQVAGVERIALASPPGARRPAAPAGACRRRALRGRGDLRDRRRPGDLRPRPRHRDDRSGRRRSPAPATPGCGRRSAPSTAGRDRLAGRALGADADRRPRHRPRVGGARPLRPGRARAGKPAGRRRGRGARARRGRGGDRARPPPSGRASPTRRWRWSRSPTLDAAIDLANAFAPEHLELLEEDAALLAERVTTAGCVFVGRYGATAFGDYAAGSNHVLPTGGAGRFSGPARARRPSAAASPRSRSRRGGRGAGAASRRPRPRRGLPRARRVSDD